MNSSTPHSTGLIPSIFERAGHALAPSPPFGQATASLVCTPAQRTAPCPIPAGCNMQLFPDGDFSAGNGRPGRTPGVATKVWRMDETIAAKLVAQWEKKKTPLVVDYEHQTIAAAENGRPAPASGWITKLAVTETLAKGTTLAATVNNGRIMAGILPGTASQPCEVAAALGAIMASEEDPARPLNTLPLTGIIAPVIAKRMGRTEQETALYNGLTPLEVGPGEIVQVVRAVSSYIKDPQGIEDVSLLDVTTMRTLDYVRKACRERISLRFPREKLSNRTPAKVRSEIIDVLLKLEELEIVENVKPNLPMLVVERDLQDSNRLNAAIPCDVVNGLHVFAGRIDLLL